MSKLSFYLAFASASSFTLYGRGGKILGRTHHNKFLRKQAIRLPDEGALRDEWVKQIYSACDVTTLPMPFILNEDESKTDDERYSHADLDKWGDLIRNSDQGFIEELRGIITELISSYGRLSRVQLITFTGCQELALDQAIKSESFAIDEHGLVDLIQKPAKKKPSKKKGK